MLIYIYQLQVRRTDEDGQPEHSDSNPSENEDMGVDESPHEEPDAGGSDEEEEWEGLGTTPSILQNHGEGSGKPNKPPTGEELRVIKDAADLFRSSSFKLQVDTHLLSGSRSINTAIRLMHYYPMSVPNLQEPRLSTDFSSLYTHLSWKFHQYLNNILSKLHGRC